MSAVETSPDKDATIPISEVLNAESKEKHHQKQAAPRLTLKNLVSALKSIESRWNDLGNDLKFPKFVLEDIERQNQTSRERLTAVLKHYLQLHPFASWRRIIRALERLEEPVIVKQIRKYAEHILDPTLTVENVARVLAATTGEWADGVYSYNLAGELMIPLTVQEKIKRQYSSIRDQKVALAKYWLRMLFNASWSTLAGTLHYLNEEAALNIAKNFLDVDHDDSLTLENLLAVFEGVSKWNDIGYRLRVPTTKQNEIQSSYPTDNERKEAILREFLQHNPGPTWREAALALYRMRHHDAVRNIYEQKFLIAPEEQRLLDIFNYTVKQNGYLNQTIMQATIQGNARSGKTSLIKVLQGKTANPVEPSTPVMEESARIELSQSTVLVEGMLWTPIEDLHEEANLVVREVMSAEQVQSNDDTVDDGYINTDDLISLPNPDAGAHDSSVIDSELHTISSFSSIESFNTLFTETFEQSEENSSLSNIFKFAFKKAKLKMSLIKNPWTLYISDVGGQLEFQELVPALTNGPSLHIIVVAAHWGLNNKCPIEYLHKNGRSAMSYKANYTVKENLLQTLATIMSTGQYEHFPKAIFVITFKDKVNGEELVEIDRELQEAVKSTEAYQSGVIEFATESRLCHFINNLKPDNEDVTCIRRTVERIGKREDHYRVQTPYTWLCLSLTLRGMKDRVLCHSTCVEAGKQCGIESLEELNAALRFLHYNIGVIRHFSDVPDLADIVIKEPQLLFDCVTELVVNTFTFERVNYSMREAFQKKGLFPVEMVKKVSTNSQLFTNQKLIAFLLYHHIIAPLEEDGETVKYFLPCSLVHAQIFEKEIECDTLPPLMIIFDTGYTPRGIFGFLVSDLLTENKEDEFQTVLDVECIYRDQLTVSIGPYVDKFCFSLHATYIKISVQPSKIKRKFPFGRICCYVRKRVVEALTEIVSKLNYNCKASHSLAFFCPDACQDGRAHPGTITFYQGEVQALKCTVSKEAKSLPSNHEFWFSKDTDLSTNRKRPATDFPASPHKRVTTEIQMCCVHPTAHQSPFSKQCGFEEPCPLGTSTAADKSILLTPEHLGLLVNTMWRARVKWFDIGLALTNDMPTLRCIETKFHRDPDDCLREMLRHWLNKGEATLQDLMKSVQYCPVQEYYPGLERELERAFLCS